MDGIAPVHHQQDILSRQDEKTYGTMAVIKSQKPLVHVIKGWTPQDTG